MRAALLVVPTAGVRPAGLEGPPRGVPVDPVLQARAVVGTGYMDLGVVALTVVQSDALAFFIGGSVIDPCRSSRFG